MASTDLARSQTNTGKPVSANGSDAGASSQPGWDTTRIGRMVPSRMLKFGVVGGIGILVNLIVLALILRFFNTRAWWASAAANFIATLHNYILNNLWTFRDHQRRGTGWLKAGLIYFGIASVSSLLLIPFLFSQFNHYARHIMREATGSVPAWVALLSQLAAILCGTVFNYFLNRTITWRLDTQPIE